MSAKKTDVEILQILKEEIERLGIEDSPSRTKMQKLYDKNKMPHPNTYVNRFGSWKEALAMIGIEYSGKKSSIKGARKKNTGKRFASSWSNLSREEIIDSALSEIHSKGIRSFADYSKLRDKDNTPAIVTITYLTGLKWSDLMSLYIGRFGLNSDEVNTNWGAMSDDELLEIVLEEMKRIDSDLYVDYSEKRNTDDTPSATTLINRGIAWSVVKDKFNKKYKNKKGENNYD